MSGCWPVIKAVASVARRPVAHVFHKVVAQQPLGVKAVAVVRRAVRRSVAPHKPVVADGCVRGPAMLDATVAPKLPVVAKAAGVAALGSAAGAAAALLGAGDEGAAPENAAFAPALASGMSSRMAQSGFSPSGDWGADYAAIPATGAGVPAAVIGGGLPPGMTPGLPGGGFGAPGAPPLAAPGPRLSHPRAVPEQNQDASLPGTKPHDTPDAPGTKVPVVLVPVDQVPERPPTIVPEPASIVIFAVAGLAALVASRRRR